MTRRTVAWLVAVPLLAALWLLAVFQPLPYVTYRPGVTANLLGKYQDKPVVQVEDRKVFRDDGQLRLTTIYVSGPEQDISLVELMRAWFDKDDAIYPRSSVYAEGTTQKEDRQASQAMMATSQDIAIANALKALDYKVPEVTVVAGVSDDTPASGILEPGDRLVAVNGTRIKDPADVGKAVQAAGAGSPVSFDVLRKKKSRTLEVTPQQIDGAPRVGVSLGTDFQMPFEVTLNTNPNIGGPSAGLMFSLAVYDTLTPGSITGGKTIAGTGTAELDGTVGPIGGIQQKIAAAERDGAELFFVPADNCAEATDSPRADEITLVRADTMESAVTSLETWVKDPAASLPTCPA